MPRGTWDPAAGQLSDKLAVPLADRVETAFAEVLEPKAGQVKVYRDADVYLDRYKYQLEKGLQHAKNPNKGMAHLEASAQARPDLEAALKLAPDSVPVLLAAADAAQRDARAVSLALAESAAELPKGSPATVAECNAKAIDYYERAIKADPADPEAYYTLGGLYASLGKQGRAVDTWRLGVAAVKTEGRSIELNLALADAYIQQAEQGQPDRLPDAENILKNLGESVSKAEPWRRVELQRMLDLLNAKIAYQCGDYERVVNLVTDLAFAKSSEGENPAATLQVRYQAWMLLGRAHAALQQPNSQREQSGKADKHLVDALVAFDQAASLKPREVLPHVYAAEACRFGGSGKDAIIHYQQALNVLDAQEPPPIAQLQATYGALIALLDEEKRTAEADRYRNLRSKQIVESVQLALQDVSQLIRTEHAKDALELAQKSVERHPADPWAHFALGCAQKANKNGDKAVEAYRKAFQLAKDSPDVQMEMADVLLQSKDPGDAIEGERALRELAPGDPRAGLQLVLHLVLRKKQYDEAIAVAGSAVESLPENPVAHIALGTAWWGKKDKDKAEAEFKEAVRLAPEALLPARALLTFYVDTERPQLARETLDQMLNKFPWPEIDRELIQGDILARIGDREAAKRSYLQAVKASQDNPAVQMQLVEFLLSGSDTADAAEAERVLRRIMPHYDPARRRLARLLIAHGGEAEWNDAQKLLEQLPLSDPAQRRIAGPRPSCWSDAAAVKTWTRQRPFAKKCWPSPNGPFRPCLCCWPRSMSCKATSKRPASSISNSLAKEIPRSFRWPTTSNFCCGMGWPRRRTNGSNYLKRRCPMTSKLWKCGSVGSVTRSGMRKLSRWWKPAPRRFWRRSIRTSPSARPRSSAHLAISTGGSKCIPPPNVGIGDCRNLPPRPLNRWR